MRPPILKVTNLSKNFGNFRVLRNVDLEVQEGEILGVVGSSGSGKTTLLKSLIGFLTPSGGDVEIRVDSYLNKKTQGPIYESVLKKQNIAKNLFGFASQDPSYYKKLTLKENLDYFGSLYNISRKSLKTNIDVLLTLMDLKYAENSLSANISGGMGRRLDIACAMIHDPEILILDEPTADLDPVLRNHIWSLVKKINKKGTTIILASHHLSEVETFCSRIAIINEGKILDVASPWRLKTKYSESQEIKIQTYPGMYSDIAKAMKKPGSKSFDIEIRGSELVLYSDSPKKALHDLLSTLDALKEELIDINISRPGLDELFLKLTEK